VKMSPLLSLKTKFFLAAALIMALSSVTWGGWFWYNEKEHLQRKLEGDARHLLTSLKAPIINALTYQEIGIMDDVGVLDTFVEEMARDPELPIVYAFIIDQSGRVLAHSSYEENGRIVNDPLSAAALSGGPFISRIVNTGGPKGEILDVALPLRVGGKRWGALRAGFSMAPLKEELESLAVQIIFFSVLFFVLGTAVFYIIGLTMSRPLKQLADRMAGIDLANLDAAVPEVRRGDEIGLLQRSFGEMILRLKKSEEERRRAVELLVRSERLAAIGKIVAGVAHEVNNPLAAMSATIYNMEGKAPPELGPYMETIRGGIGRIETIVRQLTDFDQANTLRLQTVSSDLFFRETAEFAAMVMKKAPVRFLATDSCPPTTLLVDKGKLHQVLLNLLLNAADASPPSGMVEFTANLIGDRYVLAVTDRGKGILPEEKERIFELFYTTKPAGKGSGIGLAICKRITEMLHGEIKVESRPGETTFTVSIPVDSEASHG